MSTATAHILVIGAKSYPLKWSIIARYRLQGIPGGATLADLANPDRATKALVDFAWAALPPGAPFATPLDLVSALDDIPDANERLDTAVAAAISNASPADEKEGEAKKA